MPGPIRRAVGGCATQVMESNASPSEGRLGPDFWVEGACDCGRWEVPGPGRVCCSRLMELLLFAGSPPVRGSEIDGRSDYPRAL